MDQRFFEMHDIRPWQGAPWVPLRMSVGRELTLPADEGTVSVWDGVATLAVPVANRAKADGPLLAGKLQVLQIGPRQDKLQPVRFA